MHSRSRFVPGWVTVLVLAALVASTFGCSDDESSEGTTPGAATSETATEDKAVDPNASLHIAFSFSYTSLDPHRSVSTGDSTWQRPLYDRLLTVVKDEEGRIELSPQLAKSFEVDPDGLSISFELRDDASFHDGTPFNAAAVKANIERAKGPESSFSSFLKSVTSVEVVDETHVVFRLSEVDPTVVWSLAGGQVGSMISPAAFSTDLATKPVGSGPFTLVSAQQNGEVVYQRWDGYWGNKALARQITISTVSDPNARYNGIRSGSYDLAYISPPHDADEQSLTSEGLQYVLRPQFGPYGMMLNATKPPLDDVRVRQAIRMAVDRETISKTLFNDLGPPFSQTFTKGAVGYLEELDDFPFDPEEARKLVQEAGAEGAVLSAIQSTTEPLKSLAEVLQQALDEIGLKLELTPLAAAEARGAWRKGGHHAYIDGMIARPEPAQTMTDTYLSLENPATPAPELVEMANDARVLPLGSDERTAAYEDISRYLVENPVHVTIAQSWIVLAAKPNVVGVEDLVVLFLSDLDLRLLGVTTE